MVVEKNGIKMTARDKNQLAAFLNNGWKIKEEVPTTDGASVVNAQIENTDAGKEETPAETPSETSADEEPKKVTKSGKRK